MRNNKRADDYRAKTRRAKSQEAWPTPSSSKYAQVPSYRTAIEVDANATEFPATKGAVTEKRGTAYGLGVALVELAGEHGFEYKTWDGMYVSLFLST